MTLKQAIGTGDFNKIKKLCSPNTRKLIEDYQANENQIMKDGKYSDWMDKIFGALKKDLK